MLAFHARTNRPLDPSRGSICAKEVRGHDQAIEAQLVNGITTVSIRARYYSILTWAVGAFLKRNLDDSETGHFSNASFQDFLRRVEFLTLACTNADAKDYGQLTGVLGTELFAKELAQLEAKGTSFRFLGINDPSETKIAKYHQKYPRRFWA
jgi:hypothetical protein